MPVQRIFWKTFHDYALQALSVVTKAAIAVTVVFILTFTWTLW